MESGVDILVEKPLAVDCGEARQLCLQAKSRGRQAYVGCVLRFSESLNRFRDLLGKLGRLHSVRIECRSYLPDWRPDRAYRDSYSARAAEGGVLRDLVHEIDYAGWVFGWPAAVQAWARNMGRLGIGSEEVAELLWETPAGSILSVNLDYLSRPPSRFVRASGELGTLEWDGICGKVGLALVDNEEQMFSSAQTPDEMLLAEDAAFLEACLGSPDPRLASCEDGSRALAVCDAARQAARNKREETIGYH
jgi:predicted dehydrogenase